MCGQFITNDVGFSALTLFTRPEMKGGKRAGGGPGQKIWEHIAKESRCVCEIKNNASTVYVLGRSCRCYEHED